MITFYTLPGRFGLESLSPFCMKVEVYLELAKLDYRRVDGDPRQAPKKKLPVIEDDGVTVADSSFIVEHLEKKYGAPLDAGLSEQDAARAHVLRRTFEEALYFVALWSRWAEEEGWRTTRMFFDPIPAAVRWAIMPLVRKSMIRSVWAQGTGRHSRDEIYAMGKADLRAFATLLGDSPFVLGDRPTTVDCTTYAFLANLLVPPIASPLKDYATSLPNVVAYVDRMKARVT